MEGTYSRINKLVFNKELSTADIVLEADVLKIDQIKREFSLRDKYYPMVANLLPKTEKILFRHISEYRDKNISILSSPYPTKYPIFGPDDKDIIFKCTGIDIDDMWDDIKLVPLPEGVLKKENFIPFPVLALLIMRYFKINNNEKGLQYMYYYLAYSMWWSVFKKYFKHYMPDEGKMIYTVNNFSNKFKLKQHKSVDGLLYNIVEPTFTGLYKDRLSRCSDSEIWYMIDGVKTKLNNQFNIIYDRYKMNAAAGNTIFKSDTFLDSEGTIRNRNSITSDVESLAQAFTTEFFSSLPNQKRVTLAAKMEGVSASELRTTINVLIDGSMIDDVRLFYSSLFYAYLASGDPDATTASIKSTKFLVVMSNIFKKGNSLDKNIVTTKSLMNKWLEIGSATYRATNRQATLTSFKKAIYNYFILSVTNNQ